MVTSSVIARPDDQVLRVILGIEPEKHEEKPKKKKPRRRKRVSKSEKVQKGR